ncbi:MAG: hypothetical protein PHR68_01410 [Candidatus Gracilibacteria bacterium]|nr:hypothetical protein [Candidatus Gracilibacteria bacterium]
MEKENFLLQNIAEKIAVGDNPEHKNGWLSSLFGSILGSFVISYLFVFNVLEYSTTYLSYKMDQLIDNMKDSSASAADIPIGESLSSMLKNLMMNDAIIITLVMAILVFWYIKNDLPDSKKELVLKSICDDLDYLKDSFSSKFVSESDFILFISGNFVIKFSYENGFRVAYFEKNDFLQENINNDDVLSLSIKYFLEIDKLIVEHNTGTFSNKENGAMLLIVNNYYFIENLLKHRKKLRQAINSLLESSKVFYFENMKTYCCISE